MAKGFAIHNAITNHGGIIPATQMQSSQMGNLFVRAGDGHFCPKCKCWSTVIKSHDHVIFDGKPVAYVGDQLTCGATIQPQQSHVVGESGSAGGSSSNSNNSKISLQFDEQLQLADDSSINSLFKYIGYKLQVGDKLHEGHLDSEGKTQRITSEKAEEITNIEFFFKEKIPYFYELDQDK
ncbi:PAAR domain-containing protein [Acinetobacter courvalinii]|uniref:PAAR domain-containing protein n=1 Tax=Acinetobacter courvalinii TaxID=280147 RepID=UPI0019026263|nr:PAAR domain-containing protein [Acinetobacter courvalinii]MBJ8418805.1 PAAR domain-containing protein [Acinetobacter courvalinii]MCU4578233.1 PAAR domain-containing protein [Acinetobacter courvalinii]